MCERIYDRVHKARKQHWCDECGDGIDKGERYWVSKAVGDWKGVWTIKTCSSCRDIPDFELIPGMAVQIYEDHSDRFDECSDKLRVQIGDESVQLWFTERCQETFYPRNKDGEIGRLMSWWPIGDEAKRAVVKEIRKLRRAAEGIGNVN